MQRRTEPREPVPHGGRPGAERERQPRPPRPRPPGSPRDPPRSCPAPPTRLPGARSARRPRTRPPPARAPRRGTRPRRRVPPRRASRPPHRRGCRRACRPDPGARRPPPSLARNPPRRSCQSRWSGARFRSTETRGWNEVCCASWNEDASTTSTSCPSRAAAGNGRPMLPQATASSPSARRQASIMAVVVVFPFVPVTARYGTSGDARAQLELAPQREPARAHPRQDLRRGWHAGSGHDQGGVLQVRGIVAARQERHARRTQLVGRADLVRRDGARSPAPSAPSAASTSAAAVPATPAPTTTTRSPANRPLIRGPRAR